ncbi:MAG: sulfotransferase domain-containing protein [Candidatus Paceibacterota bacterium]
MSHIPHIDFMGIGVPKAATTWISGCLHEHPEICMAKGKEVHHFTNTSNKPYFFYYDHCPLGAKRGEFSHTYLYSDEAREKIQQHFPNIKLIVSLRDPIERILSLYYYRKSKGKPICPTIMEQLQEGKDAYLEGGLYYKYLEKYFDVFPKEQIFVVIYEDIQPSPKNFMQSIYNFLEIDPDFVAPSLYSPDNMTSADKFKSKKIHTCIKFVQKSVTTSTFYPTLRPFLKRTNAADFLVKLKKSNVKRGSKLVPIKEKPIAKETKEFLKGYYQEDIEKLEKLIGKDLSVWKSK